MKNNNWSTNLAYVYSAAKQRMIKASCQHMMTLLII
uniref:Uncharacterized protein n=1 Tax=Rhizophora mucronata TaxID=61149 RepID=A0A2P2J3E0_RHIMU